MVLTNTDKNTICGSSASTAHSRAESLAAADNNTTQKQELFRSSSVIGKFR